MRQPRIRRVRKTRTVLAVGRAGAGRGLTRFEDIHFWVVEPVRDGDGRAVHAAGDDQVGTMPPAEWLDSWARTWRKTLGHHGRATTAGHARPSPGAAGRELLTAVFGHPGGPQLFGQLAAVAQAWRRYAADTTLGMHDGHGGHLTADARRGDPLVEEWQVRFGPAARIPQRHIRYLQTWLDVACDRDIGIADFAAELRALSADLARVLGERPDNVWLGRCPTELTDLATGDTRPCGAGLWQDPYIGVVYTDGAPAGARVACPRCRTCWGPRRADLVLLARDIRRAWPVDRYRRYSSDEIADVRVPTCPTCDTRTRIRWRDVTGSRDTVRWWRADSVTCPNSCPDAQQVI